MEKLKRVYVSKPDDTREKQIKGRYNKVCKGKFKIKSWKDASISQWLKGEKEGSVKLKMEKSGKAIERKGDVKKEGFACEKINMGKEKLKR